MHFFCRYYSYMLNNHRRFVLTTVLESNDKSAATSGMCPFWIKVNYDMPLWILFFDPNAHVNGQSTQMF